MKTNFRKQKKIIVETLHSNDFDSIRHCIKVNITLLRNTLRKSAVNFPTGVGRKIKTKRNVAGHSTKIESHQRNYSYILLLLIPLSWYPFTLEL